MALPTIQMPSIILPTVWVTGLETETINDIAEHTSIEFNVEHLQEKQVIISAMEVITAGVPGNLWAWIELSNVLSTTSTAYWAAIGGGGGALVPVVPTIEVPTGVTLRVHGITIPWTVHSRFARLVMQTPVSATPLTAFWVVQAVFMGKST